MQRVDVSKIIRVKTGQLVRARVSLRNAGSDARISIWSRFEDYDWCPHTPNGSDLEVAGNPQIELPMYARLCRERPEVIFEFTAAEPLSVVIKQEYEPNGVLATARISSHGKTTIKIRRLARNFVRNVSNCASQFFRQTR